MLAGSVGGRDVLVRVGHHDLARPPGALAGARLPARARCRCTWTASRRGCRSAATRSPTGTIPPGYAADDGVALLFRGTELAGGRRARARDRRALRVGAAGRRRRCEPRLLAARRPLRRCPGDRRVPPRAPQPLGGTDAQHTFTGRVRGVPDLGRAVEVRPSASQLRCRAPRAAGGSPPSRGARDQPTSATAGSRGSDHVAIASKSSTVSVHSAASTPSGPAAGIPLVGVADLDVAGPLTGRARSRRRTSGRGRCAGPGDMISVRALLGGGAAQLRVGPELDDHALGQLDARPSPPSRSALAVARDDLGGGVARTPAYVLGGHPLDLVGAEVDVRAGRERGELADDVVEEAPAPPGRTRRSSARGCGCRSQAAARRRPGRAPGRRRSAALVWPGTSSSGITVMKRSAA